MATKKSGANKSAQQVKVHNKSKAQAEHHDTGEQIENAIGRTEEFLHKNQKSLIWGLIAILVIVCGVFIVRNMNQKEAAKADNALYIAQQIFNAGEWQTALDGDGVNGGLLAVVDEYGSTRQGRLAAHYAGICYMNLGDAETALTYLKKYRNASGEAAEIINAQNAGLQAAAYVTLGDYKAAEGAYRKAVDASTNLLTTPYYLKELGMVCEKQGNAKGALEAYNRIKNEFPGSQEAQSIDLLIGAAEQK